MESVSDITMRYTYNRTKVSKQELGTQNEFTWREPQNYNDLAGNNYGTIQVLSVPPRQGKVVNIV
jgi:hypothetical protein